MSESLSALEQVKASVDPYAGHAVFARLARGTVAEITPEDDVVMRWHGLYRHRPPEAGVFMLRLKLPGGAIQADQLATVADLAERSGRGVVSLTTRQDIELHWLTLADLLGVFAALDTVGLTTLGACGDQVRNVVACPVAGLAPDEILDTTPIAEALTRAFLRNPVFANLPRKFKLAISGCARHCVPTAINDLSLLAAKNATGDAGYAVLVGGGLSAQPTMAASLETWVAPEDVVEFVSQAVSIFRDYGTRERRGRARMKHLLAERGLPWFREELETRLGRSLLPFTMILPPVPEHDHLGVHPQYEAGRVYLGIPVAAGRLTVPQLRHLAAVAATDGKGRLRLTHQQNIILPDLPESQIETIQQSMETHGFTLDPHDWHGRLVVCIGKALCNKACAHTKEVAIRLAEELEMLIPDAPFSLHISGCPNGCGQHAIADLGLQGAVVKGDTGAEERFDLWAGGGDAAEPIFARQIMARLRPEELTAVIVELWTRYRNDALDDETFSSFARRVSGSNR